MMPTTNTKPGHQPAAAVVAGPSAACGLPSWLQLSNIVGVGAWLLANLVLAGAGQDGGSTSFSTVDNKNPTAVTPANFTFAVWFPIFFLAVATVLFGAGPSRRAWTQERVGLWLLANCLGQVAWSVCVVVSAPPAATAVVTALLLLVPIIRLYVLMEVGVPGPVMLAAEKASPGLGRPLEWAELYLAHTFVSMYMGWLSVATVVSIAQALSTGSVVSNLGWSAAGWSVIMMLVIAMLAGAVLVLRQDVVYAMTLTRALTGIAVAMNDDAFAAANPTSHVCAAILAALVGSAAIVAAVNRSRQHRTAPAKEVN